MAEEQGWDGGEYASAAVGNLSNRYESFFLSSLSSLQHRRCSPRTRYPSTRSDHVTLPRNPALLSPPTPHYSRAAAVKLFHNT